MTSLVCTPHRYPFQVRQFWIWRSIRTFGGTDSRNGHPSEAPNFNQAAIRSLTLTDSLLNAIPALIHHWVTPGPISHRLINTTIGHLPAPIATRGCW